MSALLNNVIRLVFRKYPLTKGKNYLLQHCLRHVHGIVVDKDDFGNRYLLDLDNYIDSRIFLEGSYERENLSLLSELIDEHGCSIFIDVGTNIGVYPITLARKPMISSIYAFEPDPRNFAQLMANIFLNDYYKKVSCHNFAIGSVDGETELFLSRDANKFDGGKFNTGTSSLIFNRRRHQGSIIVKTKRLDDIVDIVGEKLIIKVDVEGYEDEVLEGMKNTLIKNYCIIQLEAFSGDFRSNDDCLCDLGYQPLTKLRKDDINLVYIRRSN